MQNEKLKIKNAGTAFGSIVFSAFDF